MGIADAEERVVVAPALARGITANEAQAAYGRAMGETGLTGNALGSFGGFTIRGGGF
jgi:hypothetical protein